MFGGFVSLTLSPWWAGKIERLAIEVYFLPYDGNGVHCMARLRSTRQGKNKNGSNCWNTSVRRSRWFLVVCSSQGNTVSDLSCGSLLDGIQLRV